MKHVIHYLAPLYATGIALFGCASNDITTPDTDSDTAELAANDVASDHAAQAVSLRFVHGSPSAPALDIYIGASTAPLFTAVSFGTATPYARVAPDGLQLVVRTAGAAATDAPLFTSAVITAAVGDRITSIAGGNVGSTLATAAFRVQAFTEGFARAERGTTMVRFVQDTFGFGTAAFDLHADGTVEASADSFAASDAAGVAVRKSVFPVQLAVNTGAVSKRLTAFTLSPELLEHRDGVFLVMVGASSFVPSDPRGVSLIAVGSHGATVIRQNPTVYFLPVIPDSATVDVFAFGAGFPTARLGQDVGFGALAPALQVAPSEFGYALVVTRPSTDAHPEFPLAVASTGALVAGERYLAVAAGFAERGRAPVRITVVHDGFDRTTVTAARFRAIAAAADAPSVDFGQFPPGTDTAFVAFDGLGDLSYRASSAEPGVQVSAAPLNPGVQVTGTSVALHFRSGALIATDRAFGIFAGAFAPMAADTSSRFVIVKTPASGVWTAVALVPQP